MEFNEKLQELRRLKGFTQEEVAEALFVSRAAVSKWESGRGYPGIDSLKAISRLYSVTVDELLSGDELLSIAEEDTKLKEKRLLDLVFGLLDISILALLFLPLFAQTTDALIRGVSLLSLTDTALYIRALYFSFIAGSTVLGVLTLALRECRNHFWINHKSKISLLLSALGTFFFILTPHPYAAAFVFIFLVIKALMLTKRH
jgi:transcriptional regulator with XRE-family HTH domain